VPIFELFSKRQKKLRGEMPDVYQYNDIPSGLRVQIVHIARDAVGVDGRWSNYAAKAYEFMHDALCREYGLFQLKQHASSHEEALFEYFLQAKEAEKALDVIEMCFKVIDTYIRQYEYQQNTERKQDTDSALSELNARFKEHAVGYQFESGELIRVDSELVHSEVVKPTLSLLRDKAFSGANEEFLKAHEHYRHGRNKECLVDCLKAFESTMKAIHTKRKWPFQSTDTAKSLIDSCINNGLVASFHQAQLTALRSLLESGVPTVRNKLGGHGQGSLQVSVPDHLARYALNVAATNILLLAEAERALS
jgi:hypothetical protein